MRYGYRTSVQVLGELLTIYQLNFRAKTNPPTLVKAQRVLPTVRIITHPIAATQIALLAHKVVELIRYPPIFTPCFYRPKKPINPVPIA